MKDALILACASESDFPFEWEEVDSLSAIRALLTGRARIVARYLREAEPIDPLVIAMIEEMMGPRSSNRYELALVSGVRRPPGRPKKGAARESEPATGKSFTPRELADMLDPQRPNYDVLLEFKRQRRRPLDTKRYWRDRAIGLEVWAAHRETKSVKAAKYDVGADREKAKRAVSEATVKRAWDDFTRRRKKPR
jgi:hypothetical protein